MHRLNIVSLVVNLWNITFVFIFFFKDHNIYFHFHFYSLDFIKTVYEPNYLPHQHQYRSTISFKVNHIVIVLLIEFEFLCQIPNLYNARPFYYICIYRDMLNNQTILLKIFKLLVSWLWQNHRKPTILGINRIFDCGYHSLKILIKRIVIRWEHSSMKEALEYIWVFYLSNSFIIVTNNYILDELYLQRSGVLWKNSLK